MILRHLAATTAAALAIAAAASSASAAVTTFKLSGTGSGAYGEVGTTQAIAFSNVDFEVDVLSSSPGEVDSAVLKADGVTVTLDAPDWAFQFTSLSHVVGMFAPLGTFDAEISFSSPNLANYTRGDTFSTAVTYESSQAFQGTFGGKTYHGFIQPITDATFSASTSDRVTSGTPEPAAWALMLVGFGGLGGALRRRRTALAA